MNPYLDSVGRTTLDNMRREYLNADAMNAAKYAAQGGTGGSGAAIARGQAARGYNENVASTIEQLQSAGYDRATALAIELVRGAEEVTVSVEFGEPLS